MGSTDEQLRDHVRSIADGISDGSNAEWVRDYCENESITCEHCGEEIDHELHQGDDLPEWDDVDDVNEDAHEYVPEREPGAYEWLEDALDIEYVVSRDREYLGARVLVAFGGPNIWVDTRSRTVDGYWWGDEAHASFSDGLDLDDCLQEMWNMQ